MRDLVPHISCFGTFISRQFEDGDYITVGGKIVEHHTLPAIFDEHGTEEYIKLEDGSDEIRAFVFSKLIPDPSILFVGNVVLVNGRLNILQHRIDRKEQLSISGIEVTSLKDVIKNSKDDMNEVSNDKEV